MIAVPLLLTLIGTVGFREPALAADPFLTPYVSQLKRETPPRTLERIKAVAEADLIVFHHGYGTWIRNKWLWGNREPRLVQFFRQHGIEHPDNMSMVLIQALWEDLNRSLTPTEAARIEAARALVAAKRATYAKLSTECATQLAASRPAFERCYAAHGLPSKNPVNRDPFFKLLVGQTGAIRKIMFFDDAPAALRRCLRPIIESYRFSPFQHDEELTLYITTFPNCRVAEIDSLY
jgi:hypothetical protein